MYKPLSFSTTMRNPERIAVFLKCIAPFDGKILTSDIIHEIIVKLISDKVYYTQKYEMHVPDYKKIFESDDLSFTREQVEDIIANSPQKHKEAGFSAGWESRFDTWYKFPMELGFLYYEMNSPITISETGHKLLDAFSADTVDNEMIQMVFLNAMMKYQTNNPFRNTSNSNVPLVLLLQVIQLLRNDPEENGSGIYREELSLLICWPDNDANALYGKIKELRAKYGYSYGEEIIYEECLKLLHVGREKEIRFKKSQIIGEAIDDFIRKMRITGVISLRGNGRFLDFNAFESESIDYVLKNYSSYPTFVSKREYFVYMGIIDESVLMANEISDNSFSDARLKTLDKWSREYDREYIEKELRIVCYKGDSKDPVLRFIDGPTRFEFLTSITLKQHFPKLKVCPNYHVDDEGIPTFTAAGGVADIECFDVGSNPIVEVTLMTSKAQAVNEIPAITRHLEEAKGKAQDKLIFTIFVAPYIHADAKYMAEFSKYQYDQDILPYSLNDFLAAIENCESLDELLCDAT